MPEPDGRGRTRSAPRRDPGGAAPLLYGVVFLAFVDNFALLPVISPHARTLGASATLMGVVVASYSLTNIAGNAIGGVLADRVDPRRVLTAAFGAAGVMLVAYSVVGTVGGLLVVRLAHGLAGGVLTPTVLTLVASRGRRGTGVRMGRAGAAIGAAAVVAPALVAGIRPLAGVSGVFVVVAVLLIVGAILAPRLPSAERGPVQGVVSSRGGGERGDVLAAWTSILVFTAALGTVATFLPDRVDAAGLGAAGGGIAFTLLSGVAVLVMLGPASARLDTRGPRAALLSGLVTFVVALLLAGVGTSIWTLLGSCVVFGLGFGLLYPAATTAVAQASSPDRRGRAFGGLAVCYSLGFVIGPPLSGAVADAGVADPFTAGAVVVAVGLAVVALLLPVSTPGGRRYIPRGRRGARDGDRGGGARGEP